MRWESTRERTVISHARLQKGSPKLYTCGRGRQYITLLQEGRGNFEKTENSEKTNRIMLVYCGSVQQIAP